MNSEIAKAHASALCEWADQHERSPVDGRTEIAFQFRRSARLLGKMYGFAVFLPPEAAIPDAPVEEVREDTLAADDVTGD